MRRIQVPFKGFDHRPGAAVRGIHPIQAWVLWFSIGAIGAAPQSGRSAQQAPAHSIQRIAEVFASRRAAMSSFRMEADVEHVVLDPRVGEPQVLSKKLEILMKGDSLKATLAGDVQAFGDVPVGKVDYADVQSSMHRGVYTTYSSQTMPTPQASVRFEGPVIRDRLHETLATAMGESGSALSRDISDMSILEVRDEPGGAIVIVGGKDYASGAVLAGRGNLPRVQYLLDATMDYLPVGVEVRDLRGNVTRETQIVYAENAEVGFVPESVTTTEYDRETGAVKAVFEVQMSHVAVNGPIADYEFEIEFAEGTEVIDRIRGYTYTVGEEAPQVEETGPSTQATPDTSVSSAPPPRPLPAIQRGPVPADRGFSQFIRIGFGVTCLITGLAFLFLYRSVRK